MRLLKKHSHADLSGHSLDRMAWRRFRRNPLSIASLAVIGLFLLVALLGYLITPDHTPYCNQQYLELATLKPFSKASFLYQVESGKRKVERVLAVNTLTKYSTRTSSASTARM